MMIRILLWLYCCCCSFYYCFYYHCRLHCHNFISVVVTSNSFHVISLILTYLIQQPAMMMPQPKRILCLRVLPTHHALHVLMMSFPVSTQSRHRWNPPILLTNLILLQLRCVHCLRIDDSCTTLIIDISFVSICCCQQWSFSHDSFAVFYSATILY